MKTLIPKQRRRGAATVEFALVAPLLFLLVLGILEFGRGMMVQQAITNASREGARHAALPGATVSSVQTLVVDFLAGTAIKISADDVSVSPNPSTAFNNEQITVTVAVPYSDISWIPGSFLKDTILRASTKMRSERLN